MQGANSGTTTNTTDNNNAAAAAAAAEDEEGSADQELVAAYWASEFRRQSVNVNATSRPNTTIPAQVDETTKTTTGLLKDGSEQTNTNESSFASIVPVRLAAASSSSIISEEEKLLMSSPSASRVALETRRIQERLAALRTTHSQRSLLLLGSSSGDNTKEDGNHDADAFFHRSQETGTNDVRRLSPASGDAWQAPLAKSSGPVIPDIKSRPRKQFPAAAAASFPTPDRASSLQEMERVYATSLQKKEPEGISTTKRYEY
jgi:hypothetical protein